MLYEKSGEILKDLYKAASFVIQAVCFKQTGKHISHMKDLIEVVSPEEKIIIDNFSKIKNGGTIYFDEMSEALFVWAKNLIV